MTPLFAFVLRIFASLVVLLLVGPLVAVSILLVVVVAMLTHSKDEHLG